MKSSLCLFRKSKNSYFLRNSFYRHLLNPEGRLLSLWRWNVRIVVHRFYYKWVSTSQLYTLLGLKLMSTLFSSYLFSRILFLFEDMFLKELGISFSVFVGAESCTSLVGICHFVTTHFIQAVPLHHVGTIGRCLTWLGWLSTSHQWFLFIIVLALAR